MSRDEAIARIKHVWTMRNQDMWVSEEGQRVGQVELRESLVALGCSEEEADAPIEDGY